MRVDAFINSLKALPGWVPSSVSVFSAGRMPVMIVCVCVSVSMCSAPPHAPT